jgi:hypothetical protein
MSAWPHRGQIREFGLRSVDPRIGHEHRVKRVRSMPSLGRALGAHRPHATAYGLVKGPGHRYTPPGTLARATGEPVVHQCNGPPDGHPMAASCLCCRSGGHTVGVPSSKLRFHVRSDHRQLTILTAAEARLKSTSVFSFPPLPAVPQVEPTGDTTPWLPGRTIFPCRHRTSIVGCVGQRYPVAARHEDLWPAVPVALGLAASSRARRPAPGHLP